MPTKQDVIDVFDGLKIGVPATFTQSITASQMDDCGIYWPEAHFDPVLMSKLALQTHRMFGSPTAHVPFRINCDAEAFGCRLNGGTVNSQPAVTEYVYAGDLGPMQIPDDMITVDEFLSKKSITDVIKAAELAGKNGDVFVVSMMNGPSAMVGNIIGLESALLGMITEYDLMNEWIDTVEPYVYACMQRLSEVSDGIMVIDGASTDITPPEYFTEMVGNRLRSMFRKKDGAYIILHSCGNTLEIASELADLGEDVLSPEASGYMEKYVSAVGDRTLLAGCVSPITTLMMGTPELIKMKCRESLDAGFDFITPECGIPPMTPNENIKAMFEW